MIVNAFLFFRKPFSINRFSLQSVFIVDSRNVEWYVNTAVGQDGPDNSGRPVKISEMKLQERECDTYL